MGKKKKGVGGWAYGSVSGKGEEDWGLLQRTQNTFQIYPNAYKSGPFWTKVTRRPMPRMEKGAADSTSIAARLVYILDDASGPCTCRRSVRIRRRRKQIMEVTMMFRLTVRETHGTPFSSGRERGRLG